MAYITSFTVGDSGAPPDGGSSIFLPPIVGKKIKVFREGVYQYNQKGQNFIINTNSGTIFFIPKLYAGERIRIQTTT